MASIEEERAKEMLTASWTLSSRPCDSCNSSPSLVFCRVDSAFLCLPCDTAIHAAARSGHAHARVWVCEVCERAPASVTCRADAAALCGTCDADVHAANLLARRHERVPVVPFHESPSTVRSLHRSLFDGPISCGHACGEEEEEAASWLVSDLHPKGSEATDLGSRELCFSDPYVDVGYTCVNDSVVPVPTTKGFGFPGLSVPSSIENCVVELDFRRSTATTYSHATASSLSQTVSSSSLDVGVDVVPDGNINISATTDISKPFDPIMKQDCVTVSGLDREARVQRYREKRKNRKFKKMIRYASRKVYAETRPRIKGRFAKRTEINGDADQFYSAMPALVPDGGYGVVPSFWAS